MLRAGAGSGLCPAVFAILFSLSGLSALSSCSSGNGVGSKSPATDGDRLVLFVTTEMKGTVEPCGCNSDPMGDLSRTAAVIKEARAGSAPVLVVDGGSLLHRHVRVPEREAAAEKLVADLLVDTYVKQLDVAAVGLGPFDLGFGAAEVRPARHAVNLGSDAGVALEPPEVVQAGKVAVGIFGVVSKSALSDSKLAIADPIPAARQAVADLRKRGASVVVALAHMTRKDARELGRKVPGIDFIVVGQNAPTTPQHVVDAPEAVGGAWLVQPADRGQTVARIDVAVRGAGRFSDAVGEARASVAIAELDERLVALKADLAKWEADPTADKAFVAGQKKEAAELAEQRERMAKSPLQIPAQGSWFTLGQVRIRKNLACDTGVQSAKQALDRAAGMANLAQSKKQPPTAPPAGKAAYSGIEECSSCHAAAVEFWRGTKHAAAWETLTAVGKEMSFDCVSCHVTGWDEPGGATLAGVVETETLRDVQCEVCHGPGSIHVDKDGKEKVASLVRKTPEDRCKTCHNEEHSDTFQYEAYLRDVTGPGHGEAFRKTLGDGPTGKQLRGAALEKAGRELGARCVK